MLKSWVLAAALALGSSAYAATVTVPAGQAYHGQIYSGELQIQDGFDVNGLGLVSTPLVGEGGLQVVFNAALRDYDVSAPLIGVDIDDSTGKVLQTRYGGSISLTMPRRKNLSVGGGLSITDIVFNHDARTIFATLIGQNDVGTVHNVSLWELQPLCCGYSDLVRTEAATSLIVTAGGLLPVSSSLISDNLSDGKVRTVLTVSAVPEASASALATGGMLIVLGLVRRRSRAR